jgi:hypothetical protein
MHGLLDHEGSIWELSYGTSSDAVQDPISTKDHTFSHGNRILNKTQHTLCYSIMYVASSSTHK